MARPKTDRNQRRIFAHHGAPSPEGAVVLTWQTLSVDLPAWNESLQELYEVAATSIERRFRLRSLSPDVETVIEHQRRGIRPVSIWTLGDLTGTPLARAAVLDNLETGRAPELS